MPKASELKKGFAIESNGKTLLIKDIEVTTPGGRGGAKIYKLRCTDLATGSRVDERFKSDDTLETVEMNKRNVTSLTLMVMSISLWITKITASSRSNITKLKTIYCSSMKTLKVYKLF